MLRCLSMKESNVRRINQLMHIFLEEDRSKNLVQRVRDSCDVMELGLMFENRTFSTVFFLEALPR